MEFEILGEISDISVIVRGRGVRDRDRLNRQYGRATWRKLKGVATVRLRSGRIRKVELHWYEAHGVGRREFKRKKNLD